VEGIDALIQAVETVVNPQFQRVLAGTISSDGDSTASDGDPVFSGLSAAPPLLDEATASPASRRLASSPPALANYPRF
jgi:hypothetical protein